MLDLRHLDHLGATLRRLRLAAGLSQAELGERAGLLPPQLSRWENGHDLPTLESLVKVLVAAGAGLADLERGLLDAEAAPRRTRLRKELRHIRARHRRRIESSAGLRRAVRRVTRPDPEGLEPPISFPGPPPDAGSSDDAGEEPLGARPLGVELERLAGALPATLERLLADPRHHRQAVVEHLLASARSLLRERPRHAAHAAEAARLLAAELPPAVGRDPRFRLRARALELWGRSLHSVGESAASEAALLCAFELLAQTEGADWQDLAALLRRLAAVAVALDPEADPDPYVAEAARLATAAAGVDG